MKSRTLKANEFEGVAVTVEIEGGLEGYKEAFLKIFNNVRESRELIQVENNGYNNNITVYAYKEAKEALIEWLENFGEVKKAEPVLLYEVDYLPDYDTEKYAGQIIKPYSEW